MASKKPRILGPLLIYLFIAGMAIFSLVVNIRTIPFIEKRQHVVLDTQKLKEENRKLEFLVVSANALSSVELKATEELNMTKPRRIIYIDTQ